MVPVAIGLTWAFGSGAIEFVGGTFCCGALGWLGFKFFKRRQCEYDRDYRMGSFTIQLNDAASEVRGGNVEVRAPGKPTERDGFVPPKRWDGKKVRHSETGQVGWPDRKGDVWVPTGPKGHGGPHWDVVDPYGDHKNVLPGGKILGKK